MRFTKLFDLANPHEQNRKTWDRLAREEYPLARPVGEKEIRNLGFITNPWGWIGKDVKGKRVLCLAAGGGKHSVLFALAGAETTVVDISPAMLELDRREAKARGLEMRIIEASMDSVPQLESEHFDIVIQPVSNCYVPDLLAVYREVARVRLEGGQPVALVAVAAILVAAIRLHSLDVLLNVRWKGSIEMPCDAQAARGEELGWFEHGSTILVFAPKGFRLCDHLEPGTRMKMRQALMQIPGR